MLKCNGGKSGRGTGRKEEEENRGKEEGKQHLLQSEDATPIGRPKRRRVLSQAASESHITNKFYQMLHN